MRIRAMIVITSVLFCGSPASATTIDNFEEGAFSIAVGSSETDVPTATLTGLSPENVVRGTRSIALNNNGSPELATLSLSLTPGDDSAVGFLPSGAFFFGLAYGIYPDLNLDLMAEGSDRFVVHVSEAPASGTVIVSAAGGPGAIVLRHALSGTGAYEFLFSDFTAEADRSGQARPDFTNLKNLGIFFTDLQGSVGVSLIDTVPEPRSYAMCWTGWFALALLRRMNPFRSASEDERPFPVLPSYPQDSAPISPPLDCMMRGVLPGSSARSART